MADAPPPFRDPEVARAFAAFPEDARAPLLTLRALIFQVAAETPAAGRIEETLRWGQPAYLTPETRSGTTLRLGVPKSGGYAIYTHCRTSLISEFRALFPDDVTYEGNRALHMPVTAAPPMDMLRLLIGAALTYHRRPVSLSPAP